MVKRILAVLLLAAVPVFAFQWVDADNAVSVGTSAVEIDFTDEATGTDFRALSVFVKSDPASASTCYFGFDAGVITADGAGTIALAPGDFMVLAWNLDLTSNRGTSGWDTMSHICSSGSATWQVVATR